MSNTISMDVIFALLNSNGYVLDQALLALSEVLISLPFLCGSHTQSLVSCVVFCEPFVLSNFT